MLPSDDPKVIALTQSRFKIEWAKQHINGAEHHIKFVTSRDGECVVRPYQDAKTGRYNLYIGPKKAGVPAQIPLHVGDAIHGLNTVMDYLWSGLARSVRPELTSKITFPRHETRQNLVSMLADSGGYHASIKQAFPQAEAFILDIVKPYRGAEGFIWALNKLDNINKHRLLIPTTNIIKFALDLVVRSTDGATLVFKAEASVTTNGPNLMLGFRTPFEFNDDAGPTIGVIFADAGPVSGEPVLETLINFVEAVSKVVDAFEETFVK